MVFILKMRKMHTIVFCKMHRGAMMVKNALGGFVLQGGRQCVY